jgi:hypothetical protein
MHHRQRRSMIVHTHSEKWGLSKAYGYQQTYTVVFRRISITAYRLFRVYNLST